MKGNLISKIYIGILVVVLGAFAYTGARSYRVISMFDNSKWHHEYTPGVHMLRHK